MTSIFKKRLLKGETDKEFHTFINAAILATRKGDFKEADRLAKIRIQKRRRQHARGYYVKKKDRAKERKRSKRNKEKNKDQKKEQNK